eukprot:3918134-Pleurochrysis_carterae.AAC.3
MWLVRFSAPLSKSDASVIRSLLGACAELREEGALRQIRSHVGRGMAIVSPEHGLRERSGPRCPQKCEHLVSKLVVAVDP